MRIHRYINVEGRCRRDPWAIETFIVNDEAQLGINSQTSSKAMLKLPLYEKQ